MFTHPCPGTGLVRERHPAAPGDRAVTTHDRAIYEPMRLAEAEADFSRRYPEFDPDGALAELRRLEYARLDEGGQIYLDYTGGGLHAASQIEAHAELMRARVLGNPHSNSPASLASTGFVERARRVVLEFFNAPPDDYLCVFTANASAALRLVGESYRFAPGGTFALTADNHNSVNGIREFARRKGAEVIYVPVTPPELRVDRAAMSRMLRAAQPGARNLLAFPAQSNFSGVQHRLDLVQEAHAAGWDVLVDAAAFAPASRFDVARVPPGLRHVLVLQDHGLPDRRRVPADAPGPGRRPVAAVVRRRHDHDRLGGGRRPLPAPRRGGVRGRHGRLPQSARRDDRAAAHRPGRPGRDPPPGGLPDRLAARCPRRPAPPGRTAAGDDPRTRRDRGARRHGGLLDARP